MIFLALKGCLEYNGQRIGKGTKRELVVKMDTNIMGFYANVKMLEQEEVFRHFFCCLSRERQQKIEAIKAAGGRRSSLGAWALVDHGLQQLYGLCGRDVTIAYGAHGKPYVKNELDIHFNLSHSGDYVLTVFAPTEVGCDIQQTTQGTRNERIAARFFTEAEQQALAAGMDFYRIWARKESYIKCIGDGMARDLRSFSVVEDFVQEQEADSISGPSDSCGVKRYFLDCTLPGYAMALCYENNEVLPVVWQEVNFDELL